MSILRITALMLVLSVLGLGCDGSKARDNPPVLHEKPAGAEAFFPEDKAGTGMSLEDLRNAQEQEKAIRRAREAGTIPPDIGGEVQKPLKGVPP